MRKFSIEDQVFPSAEEGEMPIFGVIRVSQERATGEINMHRRPLRSEPWVTVEGTSLELRKLAAFITRIADRLDACIEIRDK